MLAVKSPIAYYFDSGDYLPVSFPQLLSAFSIFSDEFASNASEALLSQLRYNLPPIILNALGSMPAALPVVDRLPAQ